jgi:hypothetical protein
MSGVSGVSGGQHHPHVAPTTQSAPTGAVASTSTSSDGGAKALHALQNLMSQIEGAANTKAIPAHQNW